MQRTPKVRAVEPPSWWRQTAQKSVRLLICGEALTGARVVASGAGVRLGKPSVSADGSALFVDVMLAKDAPLGAHTLMVKTSAGTATASFTVLDKPAPRLGRVTSDDVIYLIMPDRFCDGDKTNNDPEKSKGIYNPKRPRHYHGGDLAGIRKKLPYLKDLGVTTLWLTPFYDNADFAHPTLAWAGEPSIDYHGYGAIDFYTIEEHFGTSDDLHALVSEAHRLGLKLMQDQVANHCGPFHPWVKNPPTPTWFHGTPERHLDCDWNVVNLLGPYATYASKRATLEGWFAGILPDLNQSDPECRRYLIQNALWWVGVYGFDAIRQDTVPYVARDFWRDWHAALRKEFPELATLGEVNLPNAAVNAFYQRGKRGFDGIDAGFDLLYDFPLESGMIAAFAHGEPLQKLGFAPGASDVAGALAHDTLYPNPDALVTFLGLHDTQRFLGRKGATLAGLKLGATFLFTSRGIPLWYYGDEVALSGGDDPDNRRHFPGGFPGDKANKFTPEGRIQAEEDLFQHIRKLIHLRATHPALRHGTTQVLHAQGQHYVYARVASPLTPARRGDNQEKDSAYPPRSAGAGGADGGFVLVALNNDSEKPATLTLDLSELKIPVGTRLTDALTSASVTIDSPTLTLTLAPRSAQVLVR